MPKRRRIDPIRHWSIIVFCLFAVIAGTIQLAILGRYFGIKLDAQTWRDRKYIGIVLGVSLLVEFALWVGLLNRLQDWREEWTVREAGPPLEPLTSPAPGTPWLARPLICQGRVVRPGLNTATLTVKDLSEICLRMGVIMNTIEMPRCEGRLLPLSLFERIDTLENRIRHHPRELRLADWEPLIREFGRHYELDGPREPIEVDARFYNEAVASSP